MKPQQLKRKYFYFPLRQLSRTWFTGRNCEGVNNGNTNQQLALKTVAVTHDKCNIVHNFTITFYNCKCCTFTVDLC